MIFPVIASASEAIHLAARQVRIASSLSLLAMTNSTRLVLPDGQITSVFPKWCQAPFAKIFLFSPDPNQFTDLPSGSDKRGVAHVINAERDAVDAGSARDERGLLAYGQVVSF